MVKILRLLFILLLLGIVYPAGGQTHALTVVLSENSGAYKQFSEALSRELADRDVSIRVQDADTPLVRADLVIAVGMKAVTVALENAQDPVLSVLVPRDGYIQVHASLAARPGRAGAITSAIYLDQPVQRQFDFIQTLFPKIRAIGIMYATVPRDVGQMRAQAKARALSLVEQNITSTAMLPSALKEILVSSDLLLALPDAQIYNASTIRNILLATYRNRVPLIGFSSAYVKAGALAAIYSGPEQIAGQTASIVQGYFSSHSLPAAQYPREFEVSVNEQVARSLGLNIRSEAQLRQEIGKSQ